ncbi:MAG TPA: acyl-CoA dehydrogenase, partial [Thiolapillus brandeum]|nr:acyl-CoA dehydrogenase [Thiolapillus brandeum]
MWLIAFLATIAVVWILAYQGAGAAVWIGVLVASLITVTLATGIPWYLSTPLWIGATAAVLLLGVPAIRQRYVTALLLRQFRKVIPPMSRTEREALEA